MFLRSTAMVVLLFCGSALGGPPCPFWVQTLAGLSPSPRERHAMAYDAGRSTTILFGGSDANGLNGETWAWDGANWSLISNSGPSARRHHAMAYDSARGVVVLFGGWDGAYRNDTWEWDGASWTLRSTSGPAARAGHAMAFDAARGVTVLFGGYTTTPTNDTWEWDGNNWTQVSSGGPARRLFHGMAYDSLRNVTVLFGGLDATLNRRGDTWEWNGSTWIQQSAFGPSERLTFAMAFDAGAGRTTLFGGFDGNRSDETWTWDGVTWAQRITIAPSARDYTAMVYDSLRGRLVLFGGYDGSYSDETWQASDLLLSIDQQPTSTSTCPGATASFTTIASNATGYQWRRDGVFLTNGGNISGATSPVLTIDPVGPADAAVYDCVVTATCGTAVSDPASLSLLAPVSIYAHPSSATRCPGTSVSFTSAANGTEPLGYQWRRNGIPLSDGAPISGANAPTLTIDPLSPANAGNYDVVISNACGAQTSTIAALNVWGSCIPGDANCDGVVDNFDIDPFVFALTSPTTYQQAFPNCPLSNADVNLDGAVDNFDIDPFVTLLTGG